MNQHSSFSFSSNTFQVLLISLDPSWIRRHQTGYANTPKAKIFHNQQVSSSSRATYPYQLHLLRFVGSTGSDFLIFRSKCSVLITILEFHILNGFNRAEEERNEPALGLHHILYHLANLIKPLSFVPPIRTARFRFSNYIRNIYKYHRQSVVFLSTSRKNSITSRLSLDYGGVSLSTYLIARRYRSSKGVSQLISSIEHLKRQFGSSPTRNIISDSRTNLVVTLVIS